jgi:hypothetical protein
VSTWLGALDSGPSTLDSPDEHPASILILLVTLLTVFAQAALPGFRPWFGAQVDLLPALMIYTALTSNIGMVAGIAVVGGLALDSLSANPLGVSLLPLFAVG